MDAKDIIKRVRKIEIKSRGLSTQVFSGEYHSAFKGKGVSFDKVRAYEPGDDIRTIDWNLTAKYDEAFVKVFEEERALNVLLMVDLSASMLLGSNKETKRNLITEICSVLAFSAVQNNDKIGLVLFTDKVEKYIPAQRGKAHILKIIRELLEFNPDSKLADINTAISFAGNVVKKRSVVFLISDFINVLLNDKIKAIAKKHDLIVLKIQDKLDKELPDLGLLHIEDPETGNIITVDTSDKSIQKAFQDQYLNNETLLNNLLLSSKIDHAEINTGDNFINPLLRIFKSRGARN